MKINGLQVLLLGVLPSLICAMETIDVLVVLIQWENHENRTLIPKEQIDQLWNGPGNNTVVPGESISEYLESNTYGKYKVSADVHDWYKMNVTEEYASKGKLGTTGYGEDIEEILGPVLEAIVENGVNLTKYADENGQLTGIVFVHSGYAAEKGGVGCELGADFSNRIISKSWGAEEPIGTTGFTLRTFVTLSAYEGTCNLQISGIGVHVHEWLHSKFGLEDLYDTKGRYQDSKVSPGGIAAFGLMGYAGGQGYAEQFPGNLSPYSKTKLGALEPIEITEEGTYLARPSGRYPDIYMISTPYDAGEYLLIENRQHLLSDRNFWEPGGIVIYHVDENTEGYANFVRGGPFVEGWPGNGDHYKVAVLQADGRYDLEMALNIGEENDLWGPGDILGPGNGELVATDFGAYPNSDSYVRGNIRITGVTIDQFNDEGDGVWSFRVTGLSTAPTTSLGNDPSASPITDGSSCSIAQSMLYMFSSTLLIAASIW